MSEQQARYDVPLAPGTRVREREMRRQEGLPRGKPTRWRLNIRGGEIEYRGDEGETDGR